MRAGRAFWAGFLAMLLLAAALHSHADGEHLGGSASADRPVYQADGPYNSHGLRLERAAAESRPLCPLCQLRLQTAATRLIQPAPLPTPKTAFVSLSKSSAAPSRSGHASASPRGPPAAA